MASIFSASEPNLGYLYQIRYGLMLIVSETNAEAQLLIETIDDVSIESIDRLDVYQTKSHINSKRNLTDASSDLWKTLRVWSVKIKNGELNVGDCSFNLITTESASVGTIPFKLKHDTSGNRDIKEIQNLLLTESSKTTNPTNQSAYDSFRSLTSDQQKELIRNIIVIDASIDINKAKEKTLLDLRHSSLKVEPLYQRLEGWFMGQAILQLQGLRGAISAKEVSNCILDVTDRLQEDNLPNDFNITIASDDAQLAPYRSQKFVKQLELIGTNQRTINHAISDYHRAFSQKSKWMREGLISPADEIKYDAELSDDWDRKFSLISDSRTADGIEQQLQKGKAFYESNYVNQHPLIHIKDRFKERYMVTGCCQMLSDKKKIGWHPNFENKVI